MVKVKNQFICQSCGYLSSQWIGKCPDCGDWNSFEESLQSHISDKKNHKIPDKQIHCSPCSALDVTEESYQKIYSGLNEFDRVMGDGLTVGSLTLIGGEPGIGKSTLLTHVFGKLAMSGKKILYVSGEESISQIAHRIRRLGLESQNFYLYHETSWQNIQLEITNLNPDFLIIDSIQTTVSHDIASAPGTITQVREVTYEIMNQVKSRGLTCFIVGHITKDGHIAGPKILEHMVDTVVYFEGDQFGQYRILRSIKNRFGNTHEVGIFEMSERGLVEVSNPSEFFIESSATKTYGRVITSLMEGTRALFVEVQSLVVDNKFGNGRRTTQGVESNRLSMLVAILDKYFEIPLGFNDIYVNVVGGLKLQNRDSDLAILASLLSSYMMKPVAHDTLFIGEVGLTGEVRHVPFLANRIREIEKFNYKKVIIPKKMMAQLPKFSKIDLIPIQTVTDLKSILET